MSSINHNHFNYSWLIAYRKLVSVIVLFFSFSGFNCIKAQIDVYDDFEKVSLSNIWSTDRMELHSFEIQSAIVRKGKSAAKITLRTGDVIEAGNDSSLASERDELLEADRLMSREDVKYEYQFSLFIPDSFPIVPTRLIIAQWKQKCHKGSCSDDSPVLAVRYQSGKLSITLYNDSGRHYLYKPDEEMRNRWLDFRVLARFSRRDGEVQVFINDKNVVDYKGITSYSETREYPPNNNRYYFKMGLYRDRMPTPMSIFIDEYRKKEIIEKKD